MARNAAVIEHGPTSPHATGARVRRDQVSRDKVLQRVRGEFEEMPCLRLTLPQAVRLFGLREDICIRVLNNLEKEGILFRRPDGRYVMGSRR